MDWQFPNRIPRHILWIIFSFKNSLMYAFGRHHVKSGLSGAVFPRTLREGLMAHCWRSSAARWIGEGGERYNRRLTALPHLYSRLRGEGQINLSATLATAQRRMMHWPGHYSETGPSAAGSATISVYDRVCAKVMSLHAEATPGWGVMQVFTAYNCVQNNWKAFFPHFTLSSKTFRKNYSIIWTFVSFVDLTVTRNSEFQVILGLKFSILIRYRSFNINMHIILHIA